MKKASSQKRYQGKSAWKIIVVEGASPAKAYKHFIRVQAEKILKFLEGDQGGGKTRNLNILLTNDAGIRKLNAAFRGKDRPTDVLSFAPCTASAPRLPLKEELIGEIALSLETAAHQAWRSGISLEDELLRLIIHGILHLFGYEHEGVPPAVGRKMRKMERLIMEKVT